MIRYCTNGCSLAYSQPMNEEDKSMYPSRPDKTLLHACVFSRGP